LRIEGSITALATPFTAAGDIDYQAWQRLLEKQVSGGTQAIVVAGSTGEAATLDDLEFDRLLATTVELIAGRIPVLAGTGLQGTAKTIAQTRRARACGANAALIVTPPYVRPTQAGLLVHYTALAEQGGLPIVLYNVPVRTGCDLLPDTVAQLRVHPQIIGIKEARGEIERIRALLPLRGADFTVLSGDDPTAGQAIRWRRGDGCGDAGSAQAAACFPWSGAQPDSGQGAAVTDGHRHRLAPAPAAAVVAIRARRDRHGGRLQCARIRTSRSPGCINKYVAV